MLLFLALMQTQLPARAVDDPGVIATDQRITPAGVQTVFAGRVSGVHFDLKSDAVWVAGPGALYKLGLAGDGNRIAYRGAGGTYSLAADPTNGNMLFSLVGRAPPAFVDPDQPRPNGSFAQLALVRHDTLLSFGRLGASAIGAPSVASRADSTGRRLAVVPLTADDRLAVIDMTTGRIVDSIALGVAPIASVISADGATAWVSEMGGRQPAQGDLAASQCCNAKAESIRVDSRGIAERGAVARVDLGARRVAARVAVGRHPTAIAWDRARGRLYVADGNSDQVSVVDTQGDSVRSVIAVTPFRMREVGLAPTALALSPDGATLFVTLGGVNAVAMYRVGGDTAELLGMIPTAWYPSSVDVSSDGKYLAVGTLLGVGSGTGTTSGSPGKSGRYLHAVRGAVSVIEVPDAATLASYTVAVSENNRLPLATSAVAPPVRATVARAVPARPGDPSLIRHVVMIVKENRTYDQILGDLGRGDGDSSLVIYGRDVTPNTHALTEQFVTIDRFFASGGNSADGHQWLTQANETDYTLWPLYEGRSYPFDGTDPLAYSRGGFIWEAAQDHGLAAAVFGEFAPSVRGYGASQRWGLLEQHRAREQGDSQPALPAFDTHSEIPSLDRALAHDYPSYGLGVPDVVRAELFLRHLREWEAQGTMPSLVMIQLPSNHTAGTIPDWCTPKACVADNDLALGRVVEGLTHSPFWDSMAILVVEDDAQNGVDHVDGHRTVALAISPYTRRGTIDSTFHNHPSLLRTAELMLGLPALSMFDLVANDLGDDFIGPDERPDATPFTAIVPVQSIYERNMQTGMLRGPARDAARASARMRFDIPDAAPADALNRILWHDARGWDTPYPAVRQALFLPMSVDLTDGEREDADDDR